METVDNTWHLINGKSDGLETTYFNGLPSSSKNAGIGTPKKLVINGDGQHKEYSDSSISEIVIFDRTLTNEERFDINYYLSNKWNLKSTIDSDGDYKVDEIDPTPIVQTPIHGGWGNWSNWSTCSKECNTNK